MKKLFSKVEGLSSPETPPNTIKQLQFCFVFDPFWKGFGGKKQGKWRKVEYRLANLEKFPFLGDLVRLKTAFSPSKKVVYNFSRCEINYTLIIKELIKKCYAIRPISWCLWENWPLKPQLPASFFCSNPRSGWYNQSSIKKFQGRKRFPCQIELTKNFFDN